MGALDSGSENERADRDEEYRTEQRLQYRDLGGKLDELLKK